MKYLLSILCLFIFSCDSGGDDADTLLGSIMPNAVNNNWTYRFTESFYESTIVHDVVRTIINPDFIPFDYENVCNTENNNITYIFSEGIIEDDFNSGLLVECEDSSICHELIDYEFINYSSYIDNSEIFRFCSSIYESMQEENTNYSNHESGIDIVTKVSTNPYGIFNLINLDFPISVGKTWDYDIEEDLGITITYEVLSSELLTLNIQNEPRLFNVYKIGVFSDFINEMNIYLSSIGILKIEHISNDLPVTSEVYPDGTGEVFNFSINVELIDYSID